MPYHQLGTDVNAAAEYIRQGRVVAFPSGTSYGLAVDALQGHALQRLRNLKGRPDEKTFTIFLHPSLLDTFFEPTAAERRLLDTFSGQALTLLLKPAEALHHLSQDGRVGLRIIDHPLMAALAEAAATPLTATSANIAGEEPCLTPACIASKFPGLLDPSDTRYYGDITLAGPTTYDLSLAYVLDDGELPKRPPTTIVALENGHLRVTRQGALSETVLASALKN